MNTTTLRLFDGYTGTSEGLRDEVKALQMALTACGYAVSIDGHFGPGTEAAVHEFQRGKGLARDGIVGPQTWAALHGEEPPENADRETTYSATSRAMLLDAQAATRYKNYIREAAVVYGVPVPVICGIGSRESHWGRALSPSGPTGTGDRIRRQSPRVWRPGPLPGDGGGFGRGLMQIDYDAHGFARGDKWRDPRENILYGARVLADNVNYFTARDLPDVLRLAVAAYNCGAGNVRRALERGRPIDYYTAHRNYSANTLDRAAWFYLAGWR